MILIKIYGLDQYIVGNYSKLHTDNLAKLFEIKNDDIMFYSPNSFLFHKGVDQTSWNATIEVVCDEKYHSLQSNIAKYLMESFSSFSINLHIIFNYVSEHHVVEKINDKYPKFINTDNLVNPVEQEVEDKDLLDEDKVYTGNIFKDFGKK